MKIAFITDIHEDVYNLQKALLKIEKLGVDNIVCLGDIVGFNIPYYRYHETRNAAECLRLVKENCTYIIAGNHDLYAAKKRIENSVLFEYPHNWYCLSYKEKQALSQDKVWLYDKTELNPLLAEKDLEFIRQLPTEKKIDVNGSSILCSHYVYPNILGDAKELIHNLSLLKHFDYMQQKDAQYSFVGHAHFRGLFLSYEKKSKLYRFKKLKYKNTPVCIGVPSLHQNSLAGFTLFDTLENTIQAIRL